MRPSRLGGLFVIAVLAHIQSLSYWFVSTDTFGLIRSSRIQSSRDLVNTVTQPMMHGTGFPEIALFYRPLSSLSYAIDFWLWGFAPAGYHATNLVLHGLAVVLAAVVVAEVTGRAATGLVAGGLFALHPLTAEVVPAVARRQDIVLLVFLLASLALFARSRRERSIPLLGASLVAYGLALAAKEPALLLPLLVFGWVATERGVARPRAALIDSIRWTLPFALVTVGYLAVRFAVLGGLGGYRARPSLVAADVPALVAKYVLSVWYPTDVIGVGARADGAWLAVPILLAVLSGVIIGGAVHEQSWTGAIPRLVVLLGVIAGIGAIPLLLLLNQGTLGPALRLLGYGASPGNLAFPYPYPGPAAPLVGLVLVATAMAALLWSVTSDEFSLATVDGRALGFFAFWLVLPVGLFYRGGEYAIRSGYPSIVPAMALLAIVLVAGAARAETWGLRNPVVVAAALLLVVPIVAATPLLHPYDGWSASGEVNRLTLTGLETQLEEVPEDTPVRVEGIPNGIVEQQRAFPRVASIGYLGPGSIEAWLAMRDSAGERQVTLAGTTRLERRPVGATFTTESEPDRVTVRIRYVTGSAAPSETPAPEAASDRPPVEAFRQRFASPERAGVPV